ncbi:PREDICTED: malignant fibrous histiocytoma-amplified sequence 1 homolog, partial [Branchiostoma belcheri]|uniref:non-specific serine/threonine protein kinase n=1 Tax=Branchiostoma belcheri TaxID=7741 RepID=A0A6P4ZQJ4_BRABE
PAKSTISSKEQYTPCPSCIEKGCTENHGSTFLFDREQYSAYKQAKKIVFRQNRGKHPSLTIFEEIGQFTQLEEVKIDGINLDDASLSNLFRCTSIRSLTLSNCRLESIPTSLARLKDLETLDLSHNNLTTMPTGLFRSMPRLKRLNLSHNKIPAFGDVAGAEALKTFDVSFNEIEEIPYEILYMESLESFSCRHNKITRWLERPATEEQTKAGPFKLALLNLSTNLLEEVPKCLKELKNLKSLNVSHNKIRVIGDIVTELSSLQRFDVSFNDIEEIPFAICQLENLEAFDCSNNKVAKWLEPSNGQKQTNSSPLKVLNLSNNALQNIPRCVEDLKDLSEVDLSYNKIGDVGDEMLKEQLEDLFHMPSVSTLLLSNNNIKTLPELDMAKVSTESKLEKINFSNNEIREVPAALLLMPTLKALYLRSNKIEKLPDMIYLDRNKLSENLGDIDLSNNELDHLPSVLCFLPSLRKLDLKQNKISSVNENVQSCQSLSFLDVSHNRLTLIPSDVIRLPNLRVIYASNNQISSVSALRKDESSRVEVVTLEENCLTDFPEALMQMKSIKKVNISNNNIKEIPETIMDMPKDVMVDLKLQGNPIIDPPLQVCQAGIENIRAFYEDLKTASSITQCLKTLLLGKYNAGKTSLVRAFQSNESEPTKPEERTPGIEITELRISDMTFSMWDFAGQEIYYITHQFFLSAKALMLLVVNLEKYKCDSAASFSSSCGEWMKNLIAKVGNPVVIPVVTHVDKLSPEEVKRRCKHLAEKLKIDEDMRIDDLTTQLEEIEGKLADMETSESKEALKDSKKQTEVRLKERPTIHPEPVPVSSVKSHEGIQYLKQVILNYAVNKEYFPEVGRRVPKTWADAEACVEREGEELSLPYMTWDEFTALLKQNVPNLQPESRIQTVAQYLHDTGKILWYSDIESLKNHVFLKPSLVVDIFKMVIRDKFEQEINYESDNRYKKAKISSDVFQKMKTDLIKKGVLDTKFLRCLWSEVKEKCGQETFDDIFNMLIELMRQFDLCYDLDCEEDVSHTTPERLLLPWYLTEDMGNKTQWESGGSPIISLQYQFPSFIPPGLFARLTVRAHHPNHNLHFVSHWNTGALCKHEKHKIVVLLKCEDTERRAVSLSVRPESKDPHRYVEEDLLDDLWETMGDLSWEFEELLQQWPGVLYKRAAVCPRPQCQMPSFPGEWVHLRHRGPKEVICKSCDERVPFLHVTPPELATELSDQQLLRVAKKLGSEWESLAIDMGFTKANKDKFKADHRDNTDQQILAMLTAWRDREGWEATRENLKRVLREAEVDYDVVETVSGLERSTSSWRGRSTLSRSASYHPQQD